MKRISSALLLLGGLLMAGCMKNEITSVNSQSTDFISFSSTSTRASIATITDLKGGFMVYGTGGATPSAWYSDGLHSIDGTNKHYWDGSIWNFNPRIAWPGTATAIANGATDGYPMNFYALYPFQPKGIVNPATDVVATAGTPSVIDITYTVQDVALQEDLMMATGTADAKPASSVLPLPFTHALSKIDFGITPGAGTLPVIQSLQVVNVGNKRVLDLVGNAWTGSAVKSTADVAYTYYGTVIPGGTGGSTLSALPTWSLLSTPTDDATTLPIYPGPAATATTHLMLMPQTSPNWVPVSGSLPVSGLGNIAGYISLIYRMSTGNGTTGVGDVNEVGYATAKDHPLYAASAWATSGYDGPLFVKAGFPIPATSGTNFEWKNGFGYTYNIGLGIPFSCNGYILDPYYYDQYGNRTDLKLREVLTAADTPTGVHEGKTVGDPLQDGIIHVTLDVNPWTNVDGGNQTASSITVTPAYSVLPYNAQTPAFQTLTVTYRDSNGNIDPTGQWSLTSDKPWLRLTLDPTGAGAAATVTGTGTQTVYMVVDENMLTLPIPTPLPAGVTANGFRTANLYQGGVNIVAATVTQASNPKYVTPDPNPTNPTSNSGTPIMPANNGNPYTNPATYGGAFWRADQTGERVIKIDIPASQTGSLGKWSAVVAWMDPRWDLQHGDGIVLSTIPSADPNIYTDTPGNAESFQVTGTTSQFVTGTVPSTGGSLYFRIGLQKRFSDTGHFLADAISTVPDFVNTFPARYAVIQISFNDGAKVQKLFLRQGEGSDYIMRPGDPREDTGNQMTDGRTLAVKYTPYDLSDPNKNTFTNLNSITALPTNGGVFADYPSQVGYFFPFNGPAAYNRKPILPVVTTVANYTFGTDILAAFVAADETCPQGYRRPLDNPVGTAAASAAAQTEIRESLWANPKNNTGANSQNYANVMLGCYYADGFFDRRPIVTAPGTNAANPPQQYGAVAVTPGPEAAYVGILVFNPVDNPTPSIDGIGNHYNASMFIPTSGYMAASGTNGVLYSAGNSGHNWTRSSVTATGNGWNLGFGDVFWMGAAVRSYGQPVRCVRP